MLKKLLLLSVLPGIVWAAEGQGVDALNGEAGLGVDSDSDILSTQLAGRLNIPVAGYIGVSGELRYADNSAKNDYYADGSERYLGITGFVRDSSIGKLAFNYTSAYWEADVYGETLDESYNQTKLSAEGYLGSFTLAAANTQVSDFGDNNSWDFYDVSAAFYPADNAKITLGMMAEEYKLNDEDTQYVRFSFQPMNALELSAGYLRDPSDKTLSFSASYFFDTKVSLIKRDRQYR